MKRNAEEDLQQSKRWHGEVNIHSSELPDLPSDVLDIILSLVGSKDILNLLALNRRHHRALKPYVFEKVSVSWDQLIHIKEVDSELCENKDLIQTINITLPNTYHEYIQDLFGRLLSPSIFPRLTLVKVNSLNSSYWLRHNQNDNIKSLTLYSDKPSSLSFKIFDMSHVKKFANLRNLTLHNYHFVVSEGEIVSGSLNLLTLHDCTWEFPFNLVQFNLNDTMEKLCITYSSNNHFIHLERFLNFLIDPFPMHSESLRRVAIFLPIELQNKKILSPGILRSFLMAFKFIEDLILVGWIANLIYLKQLLVGYEFVQPIRLRLDAEIHDDPEKVPVLKDSILAIPNLHFILNPLDD